VNITDERLKQLIEYQNKWCAEYELDDTEHIPREGLWDTHAALVELAQYRRTFAKIEHRIVERIERDILGRIGLSGDWQTMSEGTRFGICETWRAIIREEIERKDSTP